MVFKSTKHNTVCKKLQTKNMAADINIYQKTTAAQVSNCSECQIITLSGLVSL